jgi:tRNA (guanine37-N1)-methyltransferase
MEEITIGIKVPLKQAQKIHKYLIEKTLLRKDLKIDKDKNFIYFPVHNVPMHLDSYKISKEFEIRKAKPKSYKEIVSIPDELKQELPTSYDVIGNIILIKFPQNLLQYQSKIGDALLQANESMQTVCLIEPIKGEYRTRNIKIIAGDKSTKTIHKEYGITFEIDVKDMFFSPRLAKERKRIASLVKENEVVVDMFAGVAPFSIMIAKYACPKIIYAIDKNKDATILAKKNIIRNNVLDKIDSIYADAKDIHLHVKQKADRIIMNLPFSAHHFFSNALDIAKDECVIHYYDILKQDMIQDRIDKLDIIASKGKYTLPNIDIFKIKTYAPREFYIGMDITAKKMPM